MITEIKYQGKFKSARVNQSYFLADIENGLEWPPRELQDKVSKCSWGSEATAWTSALAHKQPSWVRRLRRTLDLDDNMGTLTQASGHWLSWSSHVSGPSIPAKVPGSTLILLLPREPPSFKWPLNQGNCCIQNMAAEHRGQTEKHPHYIRESFKALGNTETTSTSQGSCVD